MHYGTSRKVAGSKPNEAIFFSIYLILSAEPGPGVYSASKKQNNNVSGEQRAAGV
jgi:hypothetical protein